ncbi:hypothetical protein A3A14_02130 [Candidatus Daviesbacteria bacterium RIFCSPLOWO2_01_FULL_43_38]|uniref:Uncharacterized protein n=2 Tax=Candidatus Daviesiibacteriota TaxID=1752718 RepID=A0A1F5K8G6_9BACT|nr:MAG: hypothetical protein UV41_C0020G0018 [Candidatus Daviesbacteria bacterium GW2011_GWA2_42_7]OGE19847.1 MAG: hypothetical protein A2874_02890 [Candidatus Daviesbacteria bacterium RIFCSPHIGHO2_01_FULL_43_17]OGE36951.1 MAG: hypothetical protein A3E45_01770 [Candidatus Daviesbacteria bacterium RIFCSPHIGHO2_12_FULL_43_11]OGE63650.1 MAG: hypothetical protein A3A14_02130 [Candidatus Daviesbacteria bacterium RIFCSPLOWO2_01_FULL_43_38]OGE70523.1 MAG: hypothetical protein A3J21_00445 [Candidatus D
MGIENIIHIEQEPEEAVVASYLANIRSLEEQKLGLLIERARIVRMVYNLQARRELVVFGFHLPLPPARI